MSYWKPAVILVAILLSLVFTALTVNPIRPAGDKSGKTKTSGNATAAGEPRYVELGEFLINLNSDYGNQYVKTSIALKLARSGSSPEIEARIPEIRHHVNLVLQSQNASELSTREGKLKLADAIREHTEFVMGLRKTSPAEGVAGRPIKNSAIADVLFTAFIIH